MFAIFTKEYPEKRARKGSKEKLKDILSKVPNVDLEPYDRID